MKTKTPSATEIATAEAGADATGQRAAQAKKALKLAKGRCKSAKKAVKQARKASRKAAKIARKAERRLDKLKRRIPKAGKAEPDAKARVEEKPKARRRVKPVTPAPTG
jgi:chromosome segregation ATPase